MELTGDCDDDDADHYINLVTLWHSAGIAGITKVTICAVTEDENPRMYGTQ